MNKLKKKYFMMHQKISKTFNNKKNKNKNKTIKLIYDQKFFKFLLVLNIYSKSIFCLN